MRYGLLCALLALGACSLSADYHGTTYACQDNGVCPGGYTCVDQRCLPDGPTPATCATAVATGDNHACAIRSDGTAWCWGRNSHGELGDGSTTDRVSPVEVTAMSLPKLTAISGGGEHTCAIGADHSVWCWGRN
ncbi:MAG TPA: hypothetical protein VH165_14950, partial [Kofleriaceae bacterium]|nr:hypothetical protein [Kofleriaceae bacterium]